MTLKFLSILALPAVALLLILLFAFAVSFGKGGTRIKLSGFGVALTLDTVGTDLQPPRTRRTDDST
jgi:hypothetical protein